MLVIYHFAVMYYNSCDFGTVQKTWGGVLVIPYDGNGRSEEGAGSGSDRLHSCMSWHLLF